MSNCQLCGKREDERNTQEQMGYTICLSCDGLYSDEELQEKMEHKAHHNKYLFYTKYYNQLKGYKIVSYEMIEDDGALAPFPSFQLTHPTKEDITLEVSMDEEGNGGGFLFISTKRGQSIG